MEYRRLGKWGVRVSEVGLGSWLTFGGSLDEANSEKVILHAYENGINFFDTANAYYKGAAEQVLGKTLKALPRESLFVATKVFFPMDKGPNDRGLSRKHVFEQCHASLKRLQMEYIDLYQCHRPDPDTPIEETVAVMSDLIRQGKILYWGVSEWRPVDIADACHLARQMGGYPPVSNQPIYNMLERYIEEQVIPVSEREGLGQVVFSPLAQGVLTGKYLPGHAPPADSRAADDKSNIFMGRLLEHDLLERVQKLKPIASDLGLSMAQLALAWCLRQPNVSSVIIGATKVEQVTDNLGASGVKLSAEVLQRIDDVLGVWKS
ncbi:MAG: aldo/keto reductase family protein [Fimbriimonadia bacterium]|jgi:voltage-dependent potassium channel beta subunit